MPRSRQQGRAAQRRCRRSGSQAALADRQRGSSARPASRSTGWQAPSEVSVVEPGSQQKSEAAHGEVEQGGRERRSGHDERSGRLRRDEGSDEELEGALEGRKTSRRCFEVDEGAYASGAEGGFTVGLERARANLRKTPGSTWVPRPRLITLGYFVGLFRTLAVLTLSTVSRCLQSSGPRERSLER